MRFISVQVDVAIAFLMKEGRIVGSYCNMFPVFLALFLTHPCDFQCVLLHISKKFDVRVVWMCVCVCVCMLCVHACVCVCMYVYVSVLVCARAHASVHGEI